MRICTTAAVGFAVLTFAVSGAANAAECAARSASTNVEVIGAMSPERQQAFAVYWRRLAEMMPDSGAAIPANSPRSTLSPEMADAFFKQLVAAAGMTAEPRGMIADQNSVVTRSFLLKKYAPPIPYDRTGQRLPKETHALALLCALRLVHAMALPQFDSAVPDGMESRESACIAALSRLEANREVLRRLRALQQQHAPAYQVAMDQMADDAYLAVLLQMSFMSEYETYRIDHHPVDDASRAAMNYGKETLPEWRKWELRVIDYASKERIRRRTIAEEARRNPPVGPFVGKSNLAFADMALDELLAFEPPEAIMAVRKSILSMVRQMEEQ